MWQLNLIHFLDFYFIFIFILSTARRLSHYRNIGKLVISVPGRWPRLLNVVREHWAVFLTWTTIFPGLLALALCVIQLLASRLIWPQAGSGEDGLTVGRLLMHWPALFAVVPFGAAMFSLDFYFIAVVPAIDRALVEKTLDQAEFWLRSPTAHVVRVVTFGRINPRGMVAVEIRKALAQLNETFNSTLWWISLQVALRFGFGLSLWLTWFITRS